MTAFHAAFSIALEGRFDDLWPHLAPDDRTLAALSVYRNTATKGRIDALEANYPTVVDMVGRDWFRAVAREYVEEEPGHDPVMAAYGDGFPAWLARFEPARPMAYLPPAARLDRAWTEAHLAEDAPTMTARQAASLGLALTGAPARLHPSARLFWFDWSAPSLWLAHRAPQAGVELSWRPAPEGLLILGFLTRPAAVGLLLMTLVIQIFVVPTGWPTHLLWAGPLVYLIARGPGAVSLDRALHLD